MSSGEISYDLRGLLVRCAKFLTDTKSDTDWDYFSMVFGLEEVTRSTPRLLQSQHFGDPDYPSCVRDLFLRIASSYPDKVVPFVRYVLAKDLNLDHEDQRRRDPELVSWLILDTIQSLGLPILAVAGRKALDITVFPDDFYRGLTSEINKAFNYGILSAVQILSRKLLENLLIDILRNRYGPPRLELYFDKGRRRFQGFEILLKNVSDNLGDFAGSPGLDSNLLKRVNDFREQGNSSAHSIELTHDPAQVSGELKELEHVVKVLVRVLQSIRSPTPSP